MKTLVFAFALASCASPLRQEVAAPATPTITRAIDEEPPLVPGARALVDDALANGGSRPTARTTPFDLDTIPLAKWGPPLERATFDLRVRDRSFHLVLHARLFAEVDVLGSAEFTAFIGGGQFHGEIPQCGVVHVGTRAARWMGFDPTAWTDTGFNVMISRGSFDPKTCAATATATISARASAIIPHWVYALRVHEDGDPLTPPSDWLYVFLPHASLIAAGGDPNAPLDAANVGTFTRVTLPLERNGAASVAMRIAPVAIEQWDRLRRGAPMTVLDDLSPSATSLVTIDVSSQADVKRATVSIAGGFARQR